MGDTMALPGQLPTKTKKIGDVTYEVMLLSAGEGLEINALLFRTLGPALAELAANMGDGGLSDLPWAAIGAALKEASVRLDADDLRKLTSTFAPRTQLTLPDGKRPFLHDVFDEHFAGKYARMYKWLAFCLEVNFADFLDEMPAALRHALAKAPSA